jgi:hypothetical protein
MALSTSSFVGGLDSSIRALGVQPYGWGWPWIRAGTDKQANEGKERMQNPEKKEEEKEEEEAEKIRKDMSAWKHYFKFHDIFIGKIFFLLKKKIIPTNHCALLKASCQFKSF